MSSTMSRQPDTEDTEQRTVWGLWRIEKNSRVKQKWIKYWISTVCQQAYLMSGLSLIFQNLFVSIWSLVGFKFVDLDIQQATLSVSEQIN